MIAQHFVAADHLLYFGRRVDGDEFDIRVRKREHPENLVAEGLADAFDALEVTIVPVLTSSASRSYRSSLASS